MNANKTTISNFFTGAKYYKIPVYQRAYSWSEKEWSQFLNDLNENGANNYFFGNVLLQKDANECDIIDGQQRITTIIIFIRAAYDVLKEKGYSAEALGYIKDDYLSYRGKSKLRSVDYDKDYFNDIIIEGNTEKHSPQTPSQKNILNAKKYFSSELKKLDIEKINSLLDTIKKAEILEVDFDTPKESILMFELQNNRGKELTNMEKLKSYLSYQIYNLCDADADEELKNITQIFEEIYRIVNDIKNISEDDILRYFNISQFGYEYRENDDDKNYKKYLKEKKSQGEKFKKCICKFKEFLFA